jgi:hypothetical protein
VMLAVGFVVSVRMRDTQKHTLIREE